MQRLLGGDTLLTLARDMHLADVTALYAAVGEGHVSAQSVVQKLVAQLGGPEGAIEDIAETAIPSDALADADRARAAATPASSSRASATSGSSSPAAARRCPATTSSASSPAAAASRCTAGPAPTPTALLRAARPARRGRVGAVGGLGLRRLDPGRGARPAPAAVRRHPGAVRRARQHPVGVGDHQPRPGRRQQVHLRDGRGQAPRPPAARRSATSKASTTSTGALRHLAPRAGIAVVDKAKLIDEALRVRRRLVSARAGVAVGLGVTTVGDGPVPGVGPAACHRGDLDGTEA